jgi:hypothetical protein
VDGAESHPSPSPAPPPPSTVQHSSRTPVPDKEVPRDSTLAAWVRSLPLPWNRHYRQEQRRVERDRQADPHTGGGHTATLARGKTLATLMNTCMQCIKLIRYAALPRGPAA